MLSLRKLKYSSCTLIEESDLLEAQAAEATWEELKLALPELNIGLVHGRMKAAEKEQVMQVELSQQQSMVKNVL
jgi:ATP-dependent DNA helicase RecG